MRYLALDIGEKRVGIAVSDAHNSLALPVKVMPYHEVIDHARPFRMLLEDYEPDMLVVGLPRSLSGEEGPQAQRVRAAAEKIGAACNLEIAYADERLSSSDAKRILREQGLDERSMRGKVDMVAASLFLQAWLDARNAQAQEPQERLID